MRMMLAFAAVLYSAAALAQSSAPPAAGADTPAADARATKPAKAAKTAAKGAVAPRLQACQDIEDGTKGRLDCYDAVIKPEPNPKAPAPKTVMQCKFTKEEDERLNCYNGFVDSMPKLPKPKS